MRAYLPDYHLTSPKTLAEALQLLSQNCKPIAGGTDLMVLFEAGRLAHRNYVSIWNLEELKGIHVEKDYVTLGSLTTYSEIRENPILRNEFPNLVQAAKETGAFAIQNRGTLGGNIANASPAADSPPALLVYDADLELTSIKGSRWIHYSNFHLDYKKTALADGEIITQIRLPRTTAGFQHVYRKVGTRKAQAISKVCFSAIYRMNGKDLSEIRISFGSVAPIPLRCFSTEIVLNGHALNEQKISEAVDSLSKEMAPISDIRSTARYRKQVAINLLEDLLRGL